MRQPTMTLDVAATLAETFEDGRKARLLSQRVSSNPWREGTALWRAWLAGWRGEEI